MTTVEAMQGRVSGAVRVLLAHTGTTQAQLADVLRVHVNTVNSRLGGRADWDLNGVVLMAGYWGCSAFDILDGPTKALAAVEAAEAKRAAKVAGLNPGAVGLKPEDV